MGAGKDSVSSRSQGAALWGLCFCVAVPFSFWLPFLMFLFVVVAVVVLLGCRCGGCWLALLTTSMALFAIGWWWM